MADYTKRLLRLKMRRGELGEQLAAKFAAVDAWASTRERLAEIADPSSHASVGSKLAALILDVDDRLSPLPLDEGFRKVASTAAEAVLRAQEELANRQYLRAPLDLAYRHPDLQLEGLGYSPTLYHAGRIARLWDDKLLGIPNKPGPLASMLVLGTLGGFAGRAASRAADRLQGTDNRWRRNLWTAGGALLGAVPGLGYAGFNAASAAGQGQLPKSDAGGLRGFLDRYGPSFTEARLDHIRPEVQKHGMLYADLTKVSTAFTQDQFQALLDDPMVAGRMPPMMSAAAKGLVEGAQFLPGRRRDLPIVTPMDVANMAVGLGSGYASGLFVGKALGGLFGLSDSAQQALRRSGAAAGLLKSIIPMAYGYQ